MQVETTCAGQGGDGHSRNLALDSMTSEGNAKVGDDLVPRMSLEHVLVMSVLRRSEPRMSPYDESSSPPHIFDHILPMIIVTPIFLVLVVLISIR